MSYKCEIDSEKQASLRVASVDGPQAENNRAKIQAPHLSRYQSVDIAVSGSGARR